MATAKRTQRSTYGCGSKHVTVKTKTKTGLTKTTYKIVQGVKPRKQKK